MTSFTHWILSCRLDLRNNKFVHFDVIFMATKCIHATLFFGSSSGSSCYNVFPF
uniref:Uncharacterized protein n=1 Tax=Arundo donax TaxID=35708 RepID=A0A0A8ZJD8_ARUDO